ncbi:MAG: cytochrome c peroxidase [Candidatus Hydrogenedentota bacterium]
MKFVCLHLLAYVIASFGAVGTAETAETEQDIVRRVIFKLEPKAKLGGRLYYDSRMSNAGANLATSCRSCHVPPFVSNDKQMFADVRDLSVIPANSTGGKLTTKRNTPNLQDATIQTSFNADGRYTDLDAFLKAKLTSLHFGWEAGSEEYSLNQIHALLFTDQGEDVFADGTYIEQFNAAMGVDINTVNQEVAIQAVIDSLIAYLETLQTTNTSAYDALAFLNRFNEGLAGQGDTPQALSGRIIGRITNQESRVSIRFPNIYDEVAYQGYKTFIRIEATYSTSSADVEDNIGNCIACHVPPKFTDGLFHNSGTAQTAYDAEHGEGAFAKIDASSTEGIDLGRYSIDVSDENVGVFKTPGLRNVTKTSPYNHDGSHATLEDVIRHKIKISEMAKAGTLRNPDPAYLTMNLTEADIPNLVAFLKTLDEVPEEDYRNFRIENVRIRQDQLGQQTYDN